MLQKNVPLTKTPVTKICLHKSGSVLLLSQAVPCFRLLVADLSAIRSTFDTRLVHVNFVLEKWHWERVSLLVFRLSPVTIIPPSLYNRQFLYDQKYLATDTVFNVCISSHFMMCFNCKHLGVLQLAQEFVLYHKHIKITTRFDFSRSFSGKIYLKNEALHDAEFVCFCYLFFIRISGYCFIIILLTRLVNGAALMLFALMVCVFVEFFPVFPML